MQRPATAALCLLVVLAGCSFGGTPTGTPTATGPSVPEGLTAETAPPGVSAETGELTNPEALLAAHQRALNATGFIIEVRSNATLLRNGQPRQVRRQQVVRASPGAARYNTTVVNPGSRFDVWGNRSVQAVRVQTGDGVRYQTGEPRSVRRLSGRPLLATYLSSGGWRVTAVEERDGGTFLTLRSSTVPTADGALPSDAENVSSYAAVIVVDTEGRVRYFEATADYTIDGNEGSVRVRQQVRSLSDPEPARPGWFAEAVA
ncbi:hypothetical protein [Halosegnis sp.]|uniref:DUF7537 family lipoprotein n=1 Tax=Halosegnis sp. TaxID=2864959 RepID=UPI0035D4D8D7